MKNGLIIDIPSFNTHTLRPGHLAIIRNRDRSMVAAGIIIGVEALELTLAIFDERGSEDFIYDSNSETSALAMPGMKPFRLKIEQLSNGELTLETINPLVFGQAESEGDE